VCVCVCVEHFDFTNFGIELLAGLRMRV